MRLPSMFRALLTSMLIGILWPSTPSASASVVAELDLRSLLSRSQEVLLGKVLARESRWSGGKIITLVQIQVDTTEKGECAAGDVITVLKWGGSVDGMAMRRYGEPTYVRGTRHLLFLRRMGSPRYRPVGLAQGAVPIQVRAGHEWLIPRLDGLAFAGGIHKNLQPLPRAFPSPELLDDALARIRRELSL